MKVSVATSAAPPASFRCAFETDPGAKPSAPSAAMEIVPLVISVSSEYELLAFPSVSVPVPSLRRRFGLKVFVQVGSKPSVIKPDTVGLVLLPPNSTTPRLVIVAVCFQTESRRLSPQSH